MDYTLKQKPEDFIVKEMPSKKFLNSGEHLICLLKKRNYTTERAVQAIASALRIPRKHIGYAGNKDSNALTAQYISIHGVPREKVEHLHLTDITISAVGYSDEPLSLGDLEMNTFEIIVRRISEKPLPISKFVNFYGEQRFSTNNADIGKAILKKEFKKAVELILEHKGSEEEKVRESLKKSEHDFVGALKAMPWKTLNMYIHAYQSKLWNEMAKIDVAEPAASTPHKLPVIGFATELEDSAIKKIAEQVLNEEKIALQDFVIRAIPDLSSAGTERTLYAEVKDLEIGDLEDDELNPGEKKVLVKFSLPKGSYATEVIKAMFSA